MSAPIVLRQQMACFNCNWNCIFPTQKNEAWPCVKQTRVDEVIFRVLQCLKEGNLAQ